MNSQSMIRSGPVIIAAAALCMLGVVGCNTDAEELALTPAGTAAPVVVVQAAPVQVAAAPVCRSCGTVTKIKKLTKTDSDGIGLIAGAVIGGVLGNQVGHGSGNDAATVAGAAGGAYVGNKIEKDVREEDNGFQVIVRMDNGGESKIKVGSRNGLEVGDRVRITGGNNIQKV